MVTAARLGRSRPPLDRPRPPDRGHEAGVGPPVFARTQLMRAVVDLPRNCATTGNGGKLALNVDRCRRRLEAEAPRLSALPPGDRRATAIAVDLYDQCVAVAERSWQSRPPRAIPPVAEVNEFLRGGPRRRAGAVDLNLLVDSSLRLSTTTTEKAACLGFGVRSGVSRAARRPRRDVQEPRAGATFATIWALAPWR